jgi:hypothetical protein
MSLALEFVTEGSSTAASVEQKSSVSLDAQLQKRSAAFDAIRFADALEPSFMGLRPGVYASCCSQVTGCASCCTPGTGTCCGCSGGGSCRGTDKVPSLRLSE